MTYSGGLHLHFFQAFSPLSTARTCRTQLQIMWHLSHKMVKREVWVIISHGLGQVGRENTSQTPGGCTAVWTKPRVTSMEWPHLISLTRQDSNLCISYEILLENNNSPRKCWALEVLSLSNGTRQMKATAFMAGKSLSLRNEVIACRICKGPMARTKEPFLPSSYICLA